MNNIHPVFMEQMASSEIDQFLTCARVGRLGLILKECAYIVPVGYGYIRNKIFFHTCQEGIKMEALQSKPNVCFEVDESISDGSLAKSVIIFGAAEIVGDKEKMLPYLQELIKKYRVPVSFAEYMAKKNRDVRAELEAVRICVITPHQVTGKRIVRPTSSF